MAVRISHWRAYYENGAVYTDIADTVATIPTDGMLGLVIFTNDGKKFRITGGDYYYIDLAKAKFGMDKTDLTTMTLRYPGSTLIRGKWTDDSAMKQCELRMKTDAP